MKSDVLDFCVLLAQKKKGSEGEKERNYCDSGQLLRGRQRVTIKHGRGMRSNEIYIASASAGYTIDYRSQLVEMQVRDDEFWVKS
jgi:hypothetical protein